MYPECLWWVEFCTLQVDTVIELCQQALAAGQCPVIGLQSTGEARTAAYVKAAQQSKQRGEVHSSKSWITLPSRTSHLLADGWLAQMPMCHASSCFEHPDAGRG